MAAYDRSSKWLIAPVVTGPTAFVHAVGSAHQNATSTLELAACPTLRLQ